MELPSQMVLFARVVQAGSFSSTARELGQSPSAVSRQIGFLEDRVGVRLLNRTKHGLSVTDEGRSFYERCVAISDQIHEAEAFASSLDDRPKGLLRVVSTVAFGKSQLLPTLSGFLAKYPDVNLSLEFTDRKLDLAQENVDVAIRFTEQLGNDNDVARKLARNRRLICASPAYLEKFGQPKTFSDLKMHNCLRITDLEIWNDWLGLEAMGGRALSLPSNLEANSADAIYHATLAGIGVARLPTYLIGTDITAGRLIHILPEFKDEASELHAIYPERRNLSSKVRVFIDYLVDCFGDCPPWEREVLGSAHFEDTQTMPNEGANA